MTGVQTCALPISSKEPIPPEEQRELDLVIKVLKKIKKFAHTNNLNSLTEKEKLNIVETRLREIEQIIKEFHFAQKYTSSLIRKVEENEVDPIVTKIFNRASSSNNFCTKITENELNKLFVESEDINAAQDSKWEILWRRWYQKLPKFEIDETTNIKEPHVTLILISIGEKRIIIF